MSSLWEKPNMQRQRYVSHDILFEISHDILFDILHRLPLTSLVRLTSVSKSWNAWIKSSSFVSAYHHSKKKTSRPHLVCMPRRGTQNCTLISETSDGVLTRVSFPPPPLSSDVVVVGSSEGLVCLKSRTIIYVWNPFIRTLKRIDSVGQFQDPGEELGFGFAPRRGDYMFVKLLRKEEYLTGAEIYSLSSDSWTTRIKAPSGMFGRYKVFPLHSKVSSQGILYWLICCSGNIYMVLRIDLDNEKMEKIEIDTNIQEEVMGIRNEIMVVNEYLVLFKFGCRLWWGPNAMPIKGYVYNESESGSLSWNSTNTVDLFRMGNAETLWPTTSDGHVIIQSGLDDRVFAYDCYCDGKDLTFKLRDLGINGMPWSYILIPIKETIHLLDKNID